MKLKRKKGFTLAETIVALAILALLCLVVGILFVSAMNRMNDTMALEKSKAQQIAQAETPVTGVSTTYLEYDFGFSDVVTVAAEIKDVGSVDDDLNLQIAIIR
jgi:prepilin-type N-terminal cleavage/methylation domain-containing protein